METGPTEEPWEGWSTLVIAQFGDVLGRARAAGGRS